MRRSTLACFCSVVSALARRQTSKWKSRYLPADLVEKIETPMEGSPRIARSVLDPLGNARTALGVMTALDWLFAKRSDAW